MHGPKPNCGHPHAVLVLQHPATIPIPHLGHDDATHAPPPEEELLDELALLPPAQLPPVHVIPLCVQSLHAAPAVPQ
jgi:hypothetical protein